MSAETDALVAFLEATGVPFRVTSTTGGQHAPGSYHYVGLAVDLAGPRPSRNSPMLLDVFKVLEPLARSGVLPELFYGGPGGRLLKGGVEIHSEALRASHEDHVHAAIKKGWRYVSPQKETAMPDDASIPNITGPFAFYPLVSASGRLTGYLYVSLKTGELHIWSDVDADGVRFAKFVGRSEVVG